MKRLPFLDWMRGLALVVMIQCHTFNSFARMDVRSGGLYAISQFIGGMAGPLFLFIAGITFDFQMESQEARGVAPLRRWLASLRRAGFILAIAFLIRLTDWISMWPKAGWAEVLRVDILNSMGVAMAAFSLAALISGGRRMRAVLLASMAVAMASPLIANLDWSGVPQLAHEYLAAGFGRGHFPFFPCAAYVGFGMTAGAAIRGTEPARMDRVAQWSALLGGMLILSAQYVSNLPYAVYPRSNFWTDSPLLVFIRTGISLVILAGCYGWTAYAASPAWSWMRCLGQHSLLVYWVHLMLVYGALTGPLQKALSIPATSLATATTVALMVALSAAIGWWKLSRAAGSSRSPKGSTAPSPPLPESGSTHQ